MKTINIYFLESRREGELYDLPGRGEEDHAFPVAVALHSGLTEKYHQDIRSYKGFPFTSVGDEGYWVSTQHITSPEVKTAKEALGYLDSLKKIYNKISEASIGLKDDVYEKIQRFIESPKPAKLAIGDAVYVGKGEKNLFFYANREDAESQHPGKVREYIVLDNLSGQMAQINKLIIPKPSKDVAEFLKPYGFK